MSASGPKSLPAIGFLTVVEHARHGLFGGYLVVNSAGRPLEFHCTAPVKPNRAQEILYGPTLRPYLYGEQIGYALVSKAKLQPLWLCIDQEPVFAMRDLVKFPVVWVPEVNESVSFPPGGDAGRPSHGPAVDAASPAPKSPASHHDRQEWLAFSLGNLSVCIARRYESDRETVLEAWQEHAVSLDLLEPFDRIRDAIEEAQRTAA